MRRASLTQLTTEISDSVLFLPVVQQTILSIFLFQLKQINIDISNLKLHKNGGVAHSHWYGLKYVRPMV